MEYKLEISTETKKNVFFFEKKRYKTNFDEIVEYVNEMVKIYKKSAKVIIMITDECDKKIAQYHYDYGWLMYWQNITGNMVIAVFQ